MIESAYLRARAARGDPVRVAVVGLGFMGKALVRHIRSSVPGMRVVAVGARDPDRVCAAMSAAGSDLGRRPVHVIDAASIDEVVSRGGTAVVRDFDAVLAAGAPEVVLDMTGALELGAELAYAAIRHGKALVTFNAEVEATVGPLLDALAEEQGVVRTIADGDQPGVQLRLADFASGVGLVPRVLGNVKGLQDVRRTPATQAEFAARWGQNPVMVTSFADGTKISFEQAVVANVLGLGVGRPESLGRYFPDHVDTLVGAYDVAELRTAGGVVDFVVGSSPGPGVFCLGEAVDPAQEHLLELFKLGPGPLYSTYVPYHLCHLEVPRTVALVAGFGTGLGNATGGPRVEVATVAKVRLGAGTELDGPGGFHTYGRMIGAREFRAGGFVPMGVAAGCRVRRDLNQDHVLRYDDVELPPERLIDELRRQQDRRWTFQDVL